MLRSIAKLLRVLNSEAEPVQVSLALWLAMVSGLTPILSPHNLLVLLLALVLRVNLSAFILGLMVFSALAYALDPLFHLFGQMVLTADPLNGLFTAMYNTTFFRLLDFNNSILMGSLLLSLLAAVPFIIVVNALIRRYRASVLAWVERTHVMKVFKASKLYRLYRAYGEIGGGP